MAQIRILSQHLVNKIAAGEVIERPASVVKELVENALDAGASRVDVAVEKAGKQLIAVTDDGAGMDAENLSRAFMPHATSKIAADDDLFAITTMGFRGEALPSIASVSHAHIRSRVADAEAGFEITAAGGEIESVCPCAAAPGTTVTVRDLFFNTPVRRKFLRGDSTEVGHISEAVTRLALPRADVAFTLTHNGRRMLDLAATDSLNRRAADVLGREVAEDLLAIAPSNGEVWVSGLIGAPAAGRASARWQYVFVNGRYIRDRQCAHAIKEAYRGLIEPSRHPVAVVFLQLPPDAVDVNVHPTKVEVRFRDGRSVHSHILAALRQTLQAAELRPALQLPDEEAEIPDDPRREGLRAALAEFFRSSSKDQSAVQGRLSFPAHHDRPGSNLPARPQADLERPTPPPQPSWSPPGAAASEAEPFTRPRPSAPPPATTQTPVATAAAPPVAMQLHDAYLVTADADGIVVIDQHALHERILYNQLAERIASGALESQRLLLPATLPITPAQRGLLDEHGELLGRLGIELTDFGPDTVAVQSFPSFLAKADPVVFLTDALDLLAEDDPGMTIERLVDQLLALMACKAAVKAGDPLTPAEIDELLAQRHDLQKATACPHGRPTQIRLTLKDLEKQFKRT